MASQSGPGSGSNVFQTTDPFHTAQPENGAPDRTENGGDDTAEDGLRLAGVRSNNPFANAENDTNDSNESAPSNAANPETESEPLVNEKSAGSTAVGLNEQPESLPTGAISPGTDGNGVSHNTDPFDHAYSGANAESRQNIAPETELQALNSNVNQDRGERGTDIFANADPAFPEGESPGHDRSDSDSGHKAKMSNDEIDSAPGQVRFAQHDEIDKTPTYEDDSDDRDDSNGIIDKIKSLGHDTKEKFHLQEMKVTGPFKSFNPTNVRMRVRFGSDDKDASKEVGIIWRSRDNRKGRNSIVVPKASMAYPNLPSKSRPVYSSSFKGVRRNLYRMAFSFPYWDMAFWSGWSYTWGSVLFVTDGIWAWGPVGWDVKWTALGEYGIGILFFVGALLYQVGAVMAYLEAVNDGSFHGSAMKRFLEGHQDEQKRMLDEKVANFFGHLNPHHEKKRHAEEEAEEKRMHEIDPEAGWKTIHRRERPGSIYPGKQAPGPRRGGVDLGEAEEGESHEYLTWRWWPTWHALKTHHIYEIGYIACSIQLFGATLYTWCGLVSVPHLNDQWTDADFYGGYWMPEILGSCCFLSASVMFLVETQERWWKIQPNVMGWWIGFWAMIGSWGFL